MSVHGIHGCPLEVTVVGCNKLKDTEWISRQDPYVCVEYGSTKNRTRTCTDGGRNPTFQEKFVFPLIEGLRELTVVVWNSNTISYDDFIGSGKVLLGKVLSEGYDDTAWPLQTKTGRHAGEVRLIMHYPNAKRPATSYAPSAPPYAAPPTSHGSMYSMPSPASILAYPPPAHTTSYPQQTAAYPSSSASPYSGYPPSSAGYPPAPYATHHAGAYPPPPYPPTSAYPPPPYPPPQPASSYYPPPGPYPGNYPPPY